MDIKMIEDVEEFKKTIKKVSGKRNITITNSYGNNEAYYNYKRQSEAKLSSKQFRDLITNVNKLIAEELVTTGSIILPVGLGTLTITAKERIPVMKNGKLIYNAPIDWNKTLELWATDPESKVAKTLVRVPPGWTYTLKFYTSRRDFKNRRYIQFNFSRSVKQALNKRIKAKKPIAFIKKTNKI